MARYSATVRTSAGSATLPIASLYAAASVGGKVREVGIFNTTATAVAVGVRRLTTAGTQGAALTESQHDSDSAAASCTGFTTHTIAPTLGDALYGATLGAAIGSGVIWTFGDTGLVIEPGTANGIGIVIPTGTGQVCDVTIVWDE